MTIIGLGSHGGLQPPICWRNNTARCNQSRRFLESIDDNFLTHVMEELMRKGELLDLALTNGVKLVEEVKVGDSLGYSEL